MNESTVAAVMTRYPDAVRPHTPFKAIAELLQTRGVEQVPVVSATGAVVGVVSGLDLLRGRQNRRRKAGTGRLTASELMVAPAPTVAADTPLAEARRTMVRSGWHQVFVVNGGRLVGVLDARALLRGFCRPDKEILADVEHEVLDELDLGPGHPVHVGVDAGVVLLTGRTTHRDELGPALVRIAAIPGVVDVKERTR